MVVSMVVASHWAFDSVGIWFIQTYVAEQTQLPNFKANVNSVSIFFHFHFREKMPNLSLSFPFLLSSCPTEQLVFFKKNSFFISLVRLLFRFILKANKKTNEGPVPNWVLGRKV